MLLKLDAILLNCKQKLQYLIIDTHSLSFFRIFLGISLLYNFIILRWSYAVEFLGKDRIIPYQVMKQLNGTNSYSIFDYIHNNSFAYIYLVLTIISTILFTIGYKSKYFSWIILLLYWNMLQTTSAYSFGYDFFTFHILFFACFLPLDNYFSIQKTNKTISPHFSISIVFLFQILFVYCITGIAKHGISWQGGYAVRNMLMDAWVTHPIASLLVDTPILYKPLTYLTRYLEILFPIFILVPSPKSIFRYIAVFFLIGFHISILLMYDVANFSITGLAVAAVLLPSHFWDLIFKTKKEDVFKKENKTIQYLRYTLILFITYILFIKNIIFITGFTAFNDNLVVNKVNKTFSKLNITSPVRVSIFMQNWRMFSPNPTLKLGWMSLEIKKEDGYNYDLFTNQLITEIPTIYWYPSGYENQIIPISRLYTLPLNVNKFKIFLKYWIPYKIKKINPTADKSKIKFVDYTFLVMDQSKPFKPPLHKLEYAVDSMINYKPF